MDDLVADLERDPRQRTAWRPGNRSAREQVEIAVVAGALETSQVHFWHHGTGEVRAFLVVGQEGLGVGPQQNARVMLTGIVEQLRPADRNLVHAGNERFEVDLVRRVAGPLLDAGGVPLDRLLELGLGLDGDQGQFDMTAFSLRLTNGANAVSHLHAETANATWHGITEQPILGVTNGVHDPTWIGQPIAELLEDLGADLDDLEPDTDAGRFWERLERVEDRDLWDAHLRQKRELALFARGRLRRQFARHGESPTVLAELETALDPDVLTIGFARRFATYKRAGLLFTDIDRLAGMLWDADRPIQIVFAGKAHQADRPGQRVIQEIFQLSRSPKLRGRVFILENYNMRVARFLVQGVDAWLNNPRRPLEASGTSGMKAAKNGVPNLSVLDGWWDEGFDDDNGWAVGGREIDPDEAAQDWRDSQDLYRLLEEDIVPRYYERDANGLPKRWLSVMRRAMGTSLWRFSTTRMLHEYVERLYLPAAGAPVVGSESKPLVTEAD